MEFDLSVERKMYPESLPDIFVLSQLSDPSICFTALQLKEYNVLDDPFSINVNAIINEEFAGSDGITYKIELDPIGLILLVRTFDLLEPEENFKSSELSISKYKNYLKIYLEKLDRAIYYTNLSSQLHKEAVQDAVDIVQTKRIEFVETKDDQIDVSGLLTVVLSIVFFELGGAAFIFNQVYTAASRLSNTKLISKLLNSLLIMHGKYTDNLGVSALDSLNRKIKNLKSELNKLKGQVVTGRRGDMLEFLQNPGQNVNTLKSITIVEHALPGLEENKELILQEIVQMEKQNFLAIGKSVARGLKDQKSNIIDPGKEVTEQIIKKNLSGSDPDPGTTSSHISIDVYFKMFIQNKYNEILMLMNNYKLLVQDLLSGIEFKNGFDTIEQAVHQKFLKTFPDIRTLSMIIEQYETFFSPDFSYTETKNYQTLEYEFMIWSLVLSNKYKEGSIEGRILAGTFKPGQNFRHAPPSSGPHKYGELDTSVELQNYLCNRFSLKNKHELLYCLSSNYMQIEEKRLAFNAETESQFQVFLQKYPINTILTTPDKK